MPVIAALSQVAEIVEQRGERAGDEKLGAQPLVAARAASLVAVHQPRHGERHVEYVLDIVVLGVARPVHEIAAVVGARHFGEGKLERLRRRVGKERAVEPDHLRANGGGIRGADRIRDVVVVAMHAHGGFPTPSIGIRCRHRA